MMFEANQLTPALSIERKRKKLFILLRAIHLRSAQFILARRDRSCDRSPCETTMPKIRKENVCLKSLSHKNHEMQVRNGSIIEQYTNSEMISAETWI